MVRAREWCIGCYDTLLWEKRYITFRPDEINARHHNRMQNLLFAPKYRRTRRNLHSVALDPRDIDAKKWKRRDISFHFLAKSGDFR